MVQTTPFSLIRAFIISTVSPPLGWNFVAGLTFVGWLLPLFHIFRFTSPVWTINTGTGCGLIWCKISTRACLSYTAFGLQMNPMSFNRRSFSETVLDTTNAEKYRRCSRRQASMYFFFFSRSGALLTRWSGLKTRWSGL